MSTHLPDRARIRDSLQAFASGSLAANAVDFLHALGYQSDKTLELEPNTADGLLELANRTDFLNPTKAHTDEWQSVDFLFQITDEEIRNFAQGGLEFDSTADVQSNKLIESYIFFAVELKADSYSRTLLADITREINRLFPMPALVLFKHGKALTLSIINRRIHKRDAVRDVLEKVTLIKDIRIEEPHRGQVEILFDLAFPQLVTKFDITNFVHLDEAWRKTLDTSELNKRFYKDLANWYFWALQHVEFPKPKGVTREVNCATNVIRLITRLIFVWFLKERELVPSALFDRKAIAEVLKDLSNDTSTYYKAILQNLFFATLNSPMNDKKAPRSFRQEGNGKRFSDQYMIHNQYRHEKLFKDSKQGLEMFAGIPFLNGGLFECLDNREEVNGKLIETRIDGFSDIPKKQPAVPNKLFFSSEEQIDLNDVYGTNNQRYTVRGIIDTLDRYKFTIAENTPIEVEVALDPELLGKVFENLLASYNPETGATARKQTGSFYTPREVVNYMVDESIITYFEGEFAPEGNRKDGREFLTDLRSLFAYTDEPLQFSDSEVDKLIAAIDRAKILDPACGSGAFPMGILQKLVFILAKIDPQNAQWKQRQIDRVDALIVEAQRIEDDKFRESTLLDLEAQIDNIEEAFERNELDYGRKLYLIENCIYGVDIQPIAIQISKLRFFISLIIDQRIRPEAANLGIRPLPNLETKFIAANTLLSLEKPEKTFLRNTAIGEKERELKIVRERYFTTRTTRNKDKYRREDERLRKELGALLESEGNFPHETTAKLIAWNPYDQNTSADFFDVEWMFGLRDGFDIVIANPPYIGEKGHKDIFDPVNRGNLKKYYQGQMDLFYFFIHLSLDIGRQDAVLAFITTNYYPTATGARNLRRDLKERTTIKHLISLGELKIFESALGQHNMITILSKSNDRMAVAENSYTKRKGVASSEILKRILSGSDEETSYYQVPQDELYDGTEYYIRLAGNSAVSNEPTQSTINKIKQQGTLLSILCNVNVGLYTGADKVSNNYIQKYSLDMNKNEGIFIVTKEEIKALNLNSLERSKLCPFYKNSDIYKWSTNQHPNLFLINISYPANRYIDFKAIPNIFRHISRYEKILRNRKSNDNGLRAVIAAGYWWSFTIRQIDFNQPKIVAPQRSLRNTFGYNEVPWYASADVYFITPKDPSISLKYVLSLLNSKLYYLWLYHRGKRKGETLELYQQPLSEIPIKRIDKDQQKPFVDLVNQILLAREKDPEGDTTALEEKLDRRVYQLYDLTPDEIAIVEASALR